MASPNIDSTVGVHIITAFLVIYLSGVLTYQFGSYYLAGFKDPAWIRYPMAILFLLTIFHSITISYMAWFYAVMNYGNPASLSEPRLWTFPLSAIITTCTAFTAQLFLIYRAYRLTRENILLVIPLFLVSLTATILGLVHGTRVWMLSSLDQIPTIMDTLTPWLSMEVAADWLIAGTLLWAIRDSRTLYRRSGEVVWQLFRTAVQTGERYLVLRLSPYSS
ncbi:hypothetical protein CC2G_014272 [Coprinopsis cinerea AmutBmut pab1-1]|nr:hypothetical protein CC2G_014272 [Coprinopsis cinerea AmutBmut pab1-1]